jgi:hypothetical protein
VSRTGRGEGEARYECERQQDSLHVPSVSSLAICSYESRGEPDRASPANGR